jgi:hypothetical protein
MLAAAPDPAELKRQVALALDALQVVRYCPEHVPAWWRLIERLEPLPPAQVNHMALLVSQLIASSALARWLQYSALWRLTGEFRYLASMSGVAAELPDPERWMSLSVIVWHHALARAQDRPAFKQLFLDARQVELLGTLGRGLPRAPRPRPVRGMRLGLQRVAIVAPHLSVDVHAGTRLAFDLRAALEGVGINTHVFAAQELALPAMGSHFAGRDQSTVAPAQPSAWQLRSTGPAQVSLASQDFSLGSRWTDLVHGIGRYAPDVVLFVGFSSPLIWALHPDYPVVGMSLHTVPPLAPVDVWLAADPQPGKELFWPGMPEPLPSHFPFRFWPAQTGTRSSRDILGVPEDALVLVSSGHRLHAELQPDWAAQILGFLDHHPQIHWLLIGVHGQLNAAMVRRHPRLHCVPHQDDLAAFMSMADIYLNPPRMGGGASVAMAMDLGMPVLSMAGSDGGDKVGDLAVSDTTGYMQRLAEWCGDAGLRQQAGAVLQRKFRDELDISQPEAGRRLIQACRVALTSFEHRQSGPQTPLYHAE